MIPASGRGPSPLLPLSYLLTAAVAFAVAMLSVPWLAGDLIGHWYHPRLLALTHTLTLGWITLAIMGASYQIVPVVLQRPIWSERLARWQLAVLVTGIVGMVAHFFIAQWPGLVWAAGLVVLGVTAHIVNLGRTIAGLESWTFTARLMAVALAGVTLTAVSGMALGIDHVRPFLGGDFYARLAAHVHLAFLGWILPMILGVAAHVYPMFLLASGPGRTSRAVQLSAFGVGVPLVVLGLLVDRRLAAVGALAVTAAVTTHVAWIIRLVRERRRRALDWPLRFVLVAAAWAAPAAALGLALAVDALRGPRWAVAYAVLALGGWTSLTIVGMMLKIVPFIVWYRAYAPLAGRAQVPMLADLSCPAAEAVAFVGLTSGALTLAAAVVTGAEAVGRGAGLLLAIGAAGFVVALGHIVHHLVPSTTGRTVTAS